MNAELLGAGRVRELLRASGIHPSRSLGQNFVIDPNTIRKTIAIADPTPNEHVLEIGAGLGSLTVGLATEAGRITALEFDERLLRVLRATLEDAADVEIVHADATRFDYSSTSATSLVGNLPYNVAAQIVLAALEGGPSLRALTVMTQREVGERLAAGPGSKTYGLTSVLVAYHGTAKVAAKVSRNAFWPVPNVDSVIVRIDRTDEGRAVPWADFAPVVRAAFAQRRKTLRAALAGFAGSATRAEEILRTAGIDRAERAERVDLAAFMRLAAAHRDAR